MNGQGWPGLVWQVVCEPSERQELSKTATLRDLMGGRLPEVAGRETMAVVSQCLAAALQGETGLGIERDAKVKP